MWLYSTPTVLLKAMGVSMCPIYDRGSAQTLTKFPCPQRQGRRKKSMDLEVLHEVGMDR